MTVFEKIAKINRVSPEEIQAEIQVAIDAAWNCESASEFRHNVFPNGKPTPEEFVRALAQLTR